jgi:hypothetical protein
MVKNRQKSRMRTGLFGRAQTGKKVGAEKEKEQPKEEANRATARLKSAISP